MGINGFNNSNPFSNLAGRQEPGLILRSQSTQKPPRPNNEKLAAIDADFISVAASIVNPDTESNNRKNKQGFNQPRFGNSQNNKNAENVYVARMEMRNPQQTPPLKALTDELGELKQQVLEMREQLNGLLKAKAPQVAMAKRDLQKPNMFADPNGNRQIDVA